MAEDWRRLYPYESRSHLVGGVRLNYVDEGRGQPLLMVHGNPTWSFYWRNLIEAFRGRRRCVAVDHVGCGMSEQPQQYDYSLRRHTDNLIELIDALDLREATLLAHDWGGAIGLGAVCARRDRFRQLVLFNTGAFPPHFVPLRIRLCRTPLLGRAAIRGLNLFARAALSMAVERPLDREVRAGLLAPYGNWRQRVAIWRFVRDIPFSSAHPTWQVLAQLERDIQQLDLPTQLIWGMRDWCFNPSCLERFQQLMPHAEVTRLEQAGHYVVEDEAEQIVALLEQQLIDEPAPN